MLDTRKTLGTAKVNEMLEVWSASSRPRRLAPARTRVCWQEAMEAVKSAYTEVPNHDIVIGHLLKHGYKVASGRKRAPSLRACAVPK